MARYLSRAELSRIAGKYIDQYYTRFGISKDAPEPIDPERLASAVLGLNVKMLPLCSDGSVLGLTVFQRCGFTVTLGDGTKLVEIFMPKDVVIDSALAADSCTGCRNFTIAHEAAHHILADQFPNDYGKAVKCRGHIAYRERNGQPSWEEWQANTLAAELLMPTFLVNAEIERAALCLPNGILYKSASDPNYEKILEMAARMGVSWSAIRIRLQQMQVIKGKPIHCHPLDIIRFGECSKSNLLEEMRRKDLDAAKKEATRWKEEVQTKVDEQDALKKEMIRVIQGTSGLDREMIQQMVNENKEALLIAQTNLEDSEKKLKEIEEQNQKAERNCSDLFTWASTYKGASFERRQAILKQFIKEVRVGRDYNIEIVLNVPLDEFEEFKRHAASAGRGKNQKNKSQNPQKVGRCTSNAGIVVLDKTAGETISIVPKNAAHAILRC